MPSEKTPLVPEGLPPRATGPQDGTNSNHGGRGSGSTTGSAAATSAAAAAPAADPTTNRLLRNLHSAPIDSFLSTRMDMDSLRLAYAAKLVLAAVEGRHVESAVDLLVLKGGFVNPLAYPIYRMVLVCVIMGHLILALWEGGKSPFPLHLPVAAAELFAFLFYTTHVLLNLWTFGVKQYRDKKWHFIFTVLSTWHFFLLAFGAFAAHRQSGEDGGEGTGDGGLESDWQEASRLFMLGAHALRPIMLISNLQTTRRVFTNVLRTASRTGSILALGAVALAFYSVLGINLFNSEQVSGYTAEGDNFDNFGAAALSLFVLTTEENFPMVADPSFTGRPLVAFPFFVSFLLLFLIVILPILLGIVLDAYAQQHAQQHKLHRNKARTALLAAYYVLDEDGQVGLSRDQLVGVLAAEAGVGIDRGHAEQLWHALVPHEEEQAATRTYLRSHSVPVTNIDRLVIDAAASTMAAAGYNQSGSDSSPRHKHDFKTPSSVGDARAERHRAHSLPLSGGGGRGRVDVHGFLQLADLLHEKVAETEEEGVNTDGCGGAELCFLAGCEGACFTPRYGVSTEVEHKVDCVWERPDENGGIASGGEDSDSVSETDARSPPENDGGERAAGSACVNAAGTSDTRQRLRRFASCSLEEAKRGAKKVVGRAWFTVVSQVTSVLLTVVALKWTPTSQEQYDRCLGGGGGEPGRPVCRGEFALRRVEGVLLLAFLVEMTTKVLAVGCRRLWRLHWAHRFDMIILGASIASYVVIGIPGNRRVLYVDKHPGLSDLVELPRAMMVLRLVTVFPQLRKLLDTMATVAAMLLKIMVLYSCVSYSFAAVGMAIFGDAKSTILEPRYSFSSLPEACLALFFLTVTNNWNDLLYPLVNTVRSGRWSAIYFVAYMLFCATMMLDVLVGVVIEGFRVSTKGPQQVPADTVHPKGSDSGEGMNSGKLSGDDDASLSGDGSSLAGGGGSAPGVSRRRRAAPRPGIPRKTSQRKYIQVGAEDMFRTDPKGELDERDVRELNEAVVAVEERLHQAWVNHLRRTAPPGNNV